MSVDFRALTISFDIIYVVILAFQVLLCTFLLIRFSQSLPSPAAVLILLGGTILLLAEYSTILAEDVRKRTFLPIYEVSAQSIVFQITESLLGAFGYFAVLASAMIMLHRSATLSKIPARMGKVVAVGGCILLARLGLAIGDAVCTYQSYSTLIYRRPGPFGDDPFEMLRKDFYVHRAFNIADLVLSGILIVIIALGGLPNRVQRLRNAIAFGLIPALLVQLILGAIYVGITYQGPYRHSIDPRAINETVYLYLNAILTNFAFISVPASILYAGWGWTATGSYVGQPSIDDLEGETSSD